MSMSRSATPT
ncbi:Homeotic protein Sex combs reduced, partial [Frankliniella fusca]